MVRRPAAAARQSATSDRVRRSRSGPQVRARSERRASEAVCGAGGGGTADTDTRSGPYSHRQTAGSTRPTDQRDARAALTICHNIVLSFLKNTMS